MRAEPKRIGGKALRKGRRTGSVAKDRNPENIAAPPLGEIGNQLNTTLAKINSEYICKKRQRTLGI